MQHDFVQDFDRSKVIDVREVARKALLQLLEPLAGFVLDSGLSTNELNSIFREAAIRSAVAKQLEYSSRINISGIAATTGIPRADISRILKSSAEPAEQLAENHQKTTNRILAAWHEDPKFTAPNGQPAELKLYGRGPTFEALAKRYGRGIPVRALLDELLRSGAVEMLPNQKMRAKASMAVYRGISVRAIKAFGDTASELLSTMLLNMRKPESPKFIANVSDASIASSSLPLFRKELSTKSADFLADVQESLNQKPGRRTAKREGKSMARVSLTVFYHESIEGKNNTQRSNNKRRNFRREA